MLEEKGGVKHAEKRRGKCVKRFREWTEEERDVEAGEGGIREGRRVNESWVTQ